SFSRGAFTVTGHYSAASTSLSDSAHATLTGVVTGLGPVYLYASTLTLNASSPENLSVPSLSMNHSSTLDGSSDVTVTGPFTWQESYVVLSGTLTAAGGIALQPGYSQLVGTHLVNQGLMTFNAYRLYVY